MSTLSLVRECTDIVLGSPRRLIKDTGLFARQILGVILSGLKGRVALLAFIGWSLRRLRQQRGP